MSQRLSILSRTKLKPSFPKGEENGQHKHQMDMEAEGSSSSCAMDPATLSQSTSEEAASICSGRDSAKEGQSGSNSQASSTLAYESESDASICESNRSMDDLYSLEDINNFLDITFKKIC